MLDHALALVAGVATVASPCILPVLPIVLASTSGRGRVQPLLIVLGFVVSFAASGILIGALAASSGELQEAIRNSAILILLAAGIACVWSRPFDWLVERIRTLRARASVHTAPRRLPQGNWGALLIGASLGLAWTPCAGPVLAAMLALAAGAEAPLAAITLFALYALGAGIPMLAIAYGGRWVSARLAFFHRRADLFRKGFGLIAIAMAALQFFHYDVALIAWTTQWLPAVSTGL